MGFDISVDRLDEIAIGRGVTASELAALDDQGFVVVPGLLPDATVAALNAEFERLVAADQHSRAHERGTRRSNASRDSDVFAVCWRHRVVLEAAAHVLGSIFQVGHVDLRDPSPGHGYQQFHPDHGPTPVPGVTATWFLDPFNADNGATRLLAGSHHSLPTSSYQNEEGLHRIADREAPKSGELLALGPSGSLLLRDARIFHAAGRNRTRGSRRSAFVFYQHDVPEPE